MDRTPLGIDVSKASFDVSLLRAQGKRRNKKFPNTPAGHAALIAWIAAAGVDAIHACLEATGTYGEALATALVDAQQTVSLVNPAAVRAFAKSQLRRSKTDDIDANVLADFCRAHQPTPWQPWPLEVRQLQGLVRRRVAVQDMLTQELNRQQAGELMPLVAASLGRHVTVLRAEIAALDAEIERHFQDHAGLRAQRALLLTIPGIAETTIARLLSECRAITDFETARAYAAFAGLTPRRWESGTLRGRTRLSKIGSAHLRQALYFPALAAIRFNPVLRAFSQRLRDAGKHKMVVVGAVMRKLLHIVYGVLKHQRPFDPTMLNA